MLIGKDDITASNLLAFARDPDLLAACERADGSWISPPQLGRSRFVEVCFRRLGEHILMQAQDVGEREKTRALRRDFVADVSHELRTPLTSLLAGLETLAQTPDIAARETFLPLLREQGRRMEKLIQDLLTLSRIEHSERRTPTGTFDSRRLLSTALESVDKADWNVAIAPDFPPKIVGDEEELRCALENLMHNAVMHAQPPFRLEATARSTFVAIAVSDSGPGIASQHLPRLTERFYRLDPARRQGGTGLGLAIVKHSATRHRGRLLIESQLGRGSIFTLELPTLPVPA
jgi:two-component system phosphate regulon sensor histidine kinase PhoR